MIDSVIRLIVACRDCGSVYCDAARWVRPDPLSAHLMGRAEEHFAHARALSDLLRAAGDLYVAEGSMRGCWHRLRVWCRASMARNVEIGLLVECEQIEGEVCALYERVVAAGLPKAVDQLVGRQLGMAQQRRLQLRRWIDARLAAVH